VKNARWYKAAAGFYVRKWESGKMSVNLILTVPTTLTPLFVVTTAVMVNVGYQNLRNACTME
jgi:hypothetical protein